MFWQVYLGWVVTIPNLTVHAACVRPSLSGMGSDDSQLEVRRHGQPGQVYLGWVVTIPNGSRLAIDTTASLSGMGSDDSQRRIQRV